MKIDALLTITYVSYRTPQEEAMTSETGYLVLGGVAFAALGTVTIVTTLRSVFDRKIRRNLEEAIENITAQLNEVAAFLEKNHRDKLARIEKEREKSPNGKCSAWENMTAWNSSKGTWHSSVVIA